jgi:hypothetical protein
MRYPTVPIPRQDPRRSMIDPFLGLEMEDVYALMVLFFPAMCAYGLQAPSIVTLALGGVAVLAAVPLVLLYDGQGRRNYAHVVAWVTWRFWSPRVLLPSTAGLPHRQPLLYVEEVDDRGRVLRRRVLHDPAPAAR